MAIDVVFSDQSKPGPSGPITAWSWDFGDGGTSTLQSPTHSYASAGLYTVTLVVTGTGSDGTATAVQTVSVVDIGTNVLTADFTDSASGLSVAFSDNSTSGPSGAITGWAWTFGDGGTSTLQNPSHTYSTAGTYTVQLTVTGAGSDGTDTKSTSVSVAAVSGTITFDGRAKKMNTLVGHEVTSSDTYTNAVKRSDGSYDYFYLYQDPKIWTGIDFTHDDMSLQADSRYGKIYNVRVAIGDSNAWQPPGSFLAANKGAAQIVTRRPNMLGQWGYYSIATKVPSWNGSPSACEWADFASLGYQTSRGDQFAFRLQADSGSPTGLSYTIVANVGFASDPAVFSADHRWVKSILHLTFNQWDEWSFAIKWTTDNTGEVHIYHRVPGATWTQIYERLNTPTYLWGDTTYGHFNQDGSNWLTVLDKLGLYYGKYGGGTVETFKESGLARATTLAAAQAALP